MDKMPENPTSVTRTSDRETVVTRSFDAPARLVFQAWTQADLMRRWWVPKSMPIALLSCEIDARTGGTYRLTFANPSGGEPMAFQGHYLEVTPHSRIVWTNEESDNGQISTLTLTERSGRTLLTLHELYPSKDVLDEEMQTGAIGAMPEQMQALADLLEDMRKSAG